MASRPTPTDPLGGTSETPSDLGLPGRLAMRRAKSFFVLLTKSVPFAGEIKRSTAARLFDPGSDWEVPQEGENG